MKTAKRIAVFVGLKVAEIAAVALAVALAVGVLFSLLYTLDVLFGDATFRLEGIWHWCALVSGTLLCLLMVASVLAAVVMLIIAIPDWLRSNWRKAGEIVGVR
jgi:hypothetical protein